MKRQHSPGPWAAEGGDHTHRYALVKDADDRTVHYKYGSGTKAEADQDEANARLIAAAPALLEALKATLQYCDPHGVDDAFDVARAAITLATGDA